MCSAIITLALKSDLFCGFPKVWCCRHGQSAKIQEPPEHSQKGLESIGHQPDLGGDQAGTALHRQV